MSRNYRTALGKHLDIDTLRLNNENVVAVGNQRVNARGDELDQKGRVIKAKSEIMNDHYRSKGINIPKEEPVYSSRRNAEANSLQADMLDSSKLQGVINELTKQLAEKDAMLAQAGALPPLPELSFPKPPVDIADSITDEIQVVETQTTESAPVRGGLANAIQKDLEYKARTGKTPSNKGKRI